MEQSKMTRDLMEKLRGADETMRETFEETVGESLREGWSLEEAMGGWLRAMDRVYTSDQGGVPGRVCILGSLFYRLYQEYEFLQAAGEAAGGRS